jgi:hypothetical protein
MLNPTRSPTVITSALRFQRGQAMSELIVAMLAVLPLLLGVIYIGKYQDLKFSAVQASRYAAFDRVYDPSSRHKTATVLAEETRARFFTDPMLKNNGAVAFQDSTQNSSNTNGTLNQNWYGSGGDPIVTKYQDVSVNVQNPSTNGTFIQGLDLAGKLNFKIDDPGIAQADVQVPLANVATFAALNNLNLKLDVSTAVLTDGFNAGGANSPSANNVHDRVFADWGLVLGKIPGFQQLLSVLDSNFASTTAWELFSDTPGPQWGCVMPDVVPSDVAPGASYDPNKNC